jgi:hypothetical protein
MTGLLSSLRRITGSIDGAAAIEAALIAPVMVTLALGSFEIGNVIARRSEIQGTMAEASGIALASEPTSSSRRETLKSIIVESGHLSAEKVTVDAAYRCGSAEDYVETITSCSSERVSSYVRIEIADSYEPLWTKFGIGAPFEQTLTRYVMIKQQTRPSDEI